MTRLVLGRKVGKESRNAGTKLMLSQKLRNTAPKLTKWIKNLVALLNERAGYSLDIRALKPSAHMGLYDPKREEEIFRAYCVLQ